MRSFVILPMLLLAAPAAAQWAPPAGAHSSPINASGYGTSREEEARIVLRDLRAACASDRRADRMQCARGLRLLAEARDEMIARRAVASEQQ